MWMKGWSRSVVVVCLAGEDLYLPSVFWCPLVGAESDSCGRNGRWKGLIFRQNRVHVHNQGAVLRKSSPRGVYPAHFPTRQDENARRPISLAHFTLDENGHPVVSPNDQGAPCCVVYPTTGINISIDVTINITIDVTINITSDKLLLFSHIN